MQATLGGLRVTRETAGFIDLAQTLRIVHGCVAQAFLMTLVALSVRLSLAGGRVEPSGFNLRSLAGSAWVAVGALYCQLILGAAMRHLGVGLAIPSFPEADPSGSWIPQAQDGYTLLNFSHTRMGALLVAALVVVAIFRTLRGAPGVAYAKPLALTAGLTLVGQITLGILVVLNQKPPTLTTFHVFLGAALLACLTALAVSLGDRLSSPKGEYL
jgi:cytochrome c oxidase assembly protein subunit 15